MKSGGAGDGGNHGSGKACLDGIQALVKGKEGAAAACDAAGNDGPEERIPKNTGSNVLVGQTNEVDRDTSTKHFEENDEANRQDLGLSHNVSNHGEIMMNGVANNNGEGKRVVCQHHGDAVQKNGNENTAPGGGHDKRNDLIRRGSILGQRREHLASVVETVAEHAHVSDSGSGHEEEVGERILEQEGCRVWWGRLFILALLGQHSNNDKLE
mmetsp:Transcript_21272/g.61034  ORF Transcript_21272/g.61034 Transcript_21272/m.61034 type:complete len:212 (-) Transcript_21272:104-739(-)